MTRFLDITFSLMALLVLSPLLILTALILKFTGEGEVFYLQERVGKNKKIFHLYKFATMVKKSPSIGNKTITIKNDPRILPFGRYLRKTKINELPQLLNILFGNLSIVGPRPLTLEIFLLYPEKTQFLITQIKPGLSGIGSIVFRNEENILNQSSDNLEIYKKNIIPYKGELEIWFTQNNTLINYFKIIFLTIVVVLFPKNKSIWRLFKNLPSAPLKLKKLL